MSDDQKTPPEKPIRSPCISVCTLDEDDVCIGCFRSMDEITGWMGMNREQRLECLKRCHERSHSKPGRWL
jgi:predicted Fe-S protein YdhL (DUF1289 family)